jgi:hypothetical protein
VKRLPLVLGSLLLAVSACAPEVVDDPTVDAAPTQESTSPPAVVAPPAPQPSADGPCPYLDESVVEDANGQRVGSVEISADEPPTCFFMRSDGNVQATVRIYTGDAAVAKAIVDEAAPVATANPAELAGGWTGGAQASDDGAVYAVLKEGSAVVVATNQGQTIKAKLIAQEAITALGL